MWGADWERKQRQRAKLTRQMGKGRQEQRGHQEETPSSLIGWVMHGAPENGSVIIYCCAVQHTWLTVMSPVMVSATLFWGEEIATVCKQMQSLLFFTFKYALSPCGG